MRQRILIGTLAGVLLTGCGAATDPAPSASFDPAALSGDLAVIQRVSASGPWRSLQVLSPHITTGLAGTSSILAPQLPPGVRGVTFVLDPVSQQYVPDSARLGGPANGVRFVLYETDSLTGQPDLAVETGYVDLTDEGDPLSPSVALRLQAVLAGVTRLDYRIRATGLGAAGALEVKGFVDPGAERVEFLVGARGIQVADTAAAEVNFAIGVPARAFLATAQLQHLRLSGDSVGAITLNVRQGFNQVGMTAHASPGEVAALFQVNGLPFATAAGDPASPDLRGADGRALGPEEIAVLLGIHRLAGEVLAMFNDLMQPAGGVLGPASAAGNGGLSGSASSGSGR